MTEPNAREVAEAIYERLAHGDEEHRRWLLEKMLTEAAIIQSYGDARVAEVVAWLRSEAADYETDGPRMALIYQADCIERGYHTRAAHNPAEQGDGK